MKAEELSIKAIDEMFESYGFRVVKNSDNYELVYPESETVDDVVAECEASNDDEAYKLLYPEAVEYVKDNDLSPLPKEVEVDAGSDDYVVYGLSRFLRDETLEDCPIKIISREEIEGEEAELVRFVFGKHEESCVAVVYNDGTIYTPDDWETPIWDNDDWTIEDSEWMDCEFRRCVNFNGMPRMLC